MPDNPTGPSCTWPGGIEGVSVTVNFLANSDGLSSLYYQHYREGKGKVFEPQGPVNGFPVLLDLDVDGRSQGSCSLSIGMNDRDVMFVQLTETPGGKPCDDVRQVALSATKTVQAAGS